MCYYDFHHHLHCKCEMSKASKSVRGRNSHFILQLRKRGGKRGQTIAKATQLMNVGAKLQTQTCWLYSSGSFHCVPSPLLVSCVLDNDVCGKHPWADGKSTVMESECPDPRSHLLTGGICDFPLWTSASPCKMDNNHLLGVLWGG